LYESVGLIVIIHHRGKIEGCNTIRASVWIEQEVAIATLMEQVLGRPLYVARRVAMNQKPERPKGLLQMQTS